MHKRGKLEAAYPFDQGNGEAVVVGSPKNNSQKKWSYEESQMT